MVGRQVVEKKSGCMKRLISVVPVSMLLVQAAVAGPAGLSMGMTLADVHQAGQVAPGRSRHVYTLTREPDRDNPFSAYQLFITPTFGLCKIVAVGPVLAPGASADLLAAFKEEERMLAGRYGSVQGEEDKSGALSAYWYDPGQGLMQDDLRAVKLEANRLKSGDGYLSIAYEFRNFVDCQQEDEESGRAGL